MDTMPISAKALKESRVDDTHSTMMKINSLIQDTDRTGKRSLAFEVWGNINKAKMVETFRDLGYKDVGFRSRYGTVSDELDGNIFSLRWD